MDKNIPHANRERLAALIHSPDRLLDLLSSFSNLRSNNQVLITQLRGSIEELRDLKSKLRKHQGSFGAPRSGNGTDPSGLAERFGLTRREVQVAMLLARGRSNQAIARELHISPHTARHHTQRILSKLEVHSRGEAGAKIRG